MSANDEIPQVPDDAPSAILFRLSYRANEDHRSGYRPGDNTERIVASMRGWCFTPRTTKSSRTAKVPGYVEDAWIGQAGKRVPVSMRDTIVAYWPTSPIDSPRDLVGKALELLGRGLQPRMHAVFELRYGDDWHYELRKQYGILMPDKHVPLHDPFVYLRALLKREEAATFEKVFTVTTQPTLEHLRDARNRWAHFDTIDATQASQDVREMQMLLADLGAVDEARRMAQIQRTLDLMVRSASS